MNNNIRYIFILTILFSNNIFSQVTSTLIAPANPTPEISDWESDNGNPISYTVVNYNTLAFEARIKGRLEIGGNLMANISPLSSPVITFEPGNKTLTNVDLFQLEDVQFTDPNLQASIALSGKLPAGTYNYCVELTHPDDINSIISSSCVVFIISENQLPILQLPINEAVVLPELANAINFSWTPIVPAVTAPQTLKYKFIFSEIAEGQNAQTALSGNVPVLEIDIDETAGYTAHNLLWPPSLTAEDGKYAWTIRSTDDNNVPYGNNSQQGFSSPHVLIIGDTSTPPPLLDELTGDTLYAGEDGEFKIVLDPNVASNEGTFTGTGKVLIPMFRAWFKVQFAGIKVDQNMRLAEGTVSVPRYQNAPEYPIDWAFQVAGTMPWTHNVVAGVDNFIESVANPLPITLEPDLIEDAYDDAADNLLEVPQGVNGADIGTVEDINMAFTHIMFKPNESEIGAVMSVACPPSWAVLDGTDKIGFKASNFLFHPKKFEFSRGRLEIVSDLHINPPGDKFKLIFRKPTPNDADTVRFGTYYAWNTNDSTSFFSVDLDAQFDRSVMVPVPDENSNKVLAQFSATSEDWDDLILFGNLPLSEIVSTNGVRIEASNMFLDMSHNRNVSTMTFPENYEFDPQVPEDNWKGFCMENAYVRLPDGIKSSTNGPIGIGASNVIIDKTGFTFDLYAENIFSFPQVVNLSTMAASIDTVRLSVLQNTITSGGLKGKVILPISEADDINGVEYTAMWNNGIPNEFMGDSEFNGFTFTVNPIDTINANIWKARLFLMPTSSIGMVIGTGEDDNKGDFGAYLNLDGKLTIRTRLGAVGDVKLPGLEFQGLGISYKKYSDQEEGTFNFNGGSWSFASPQKAIKGFPFSIGGINIENKTNHDGELYRGALNVTGDINFTEDIGGGLELANVFAIRKDNLSSDDEYTEPSNPNVTPVQQHHSAPTQNSGMAYKPFAFTFPEDNLIHKITNFNPTFPQPGAIGELADRLTAKYIKSTIDCVYVDAEVASVKILGYVKFRNDDPVFGNGFKGELYAEFKSLNIEAEALVEFGNTSYLSLNDGEPYKYWRVEAGIATTGTGIQVFPALFIKGGSLGAFKNMTSAIAGSGGTNAQCDELFKEPLPVINKLTSGLYFTPKESNWGFMAKIRCTGAKEEAFNFDVGLKAEFSVGGGMQNIVLRGDFFIGAEIAKRDDAMGSGYVQIGYDHPQRKFEINAFLQFEKKPITAEVPLNVLIDGVGPGDDTQTEFNWRLCLGTFSEPCFVTVDLTDDVDDAIDDASGENIETGTGDAGSATMLNANFYLMTGKDIEVVNGFTQQFMDDYEMAMADTDAGSEGNEMSSLGEMSSQVGNQGGDMSGGDGFALGVGVRLGRPDPVFKKVLGSDKVTFWYRFGAGGEFNLGLYDFSDYTCEGLDYDPIGMNGWRASGNFGFWAVAGAGFKVKKIKILWKEYCENGCNATLFDLGLGAWIFGEMPKPTFVAGGIDGRVNILGMFKVKFKAKFDFGKKCDLVENTNGIDESFFDDLEFVTASEYDRRDLGTDNLKFLFAGEIDNEEYYITNSETGEDELYEIAPGFQAISYDFKHNNGSSNGFYAGSSSDGIVQNSQMRISGNIDMGADIGNTEICLRNVGRWNRVGVHKVGASLGGCTMSSGPSLRTKKNKNNVLSFSTDVIIMKRPPNGGQNNWSPLTFSGNTIIKPYSKNYSASDLKN